MMNEPKQTGSSHPEERISAFEPVTLVLGVLLAFLSAAICMQIIGKVGVTPNTSLIGAIFAMVLARIPLQMTKKYRSLQRQNMLQTIVSGAGFSAANCGFIAVAILFIMGETKAILPMAIGCMIGSVVSVFIVGRLFDSKIFPASGAWPPGVATASAIEAGDEGGKKGLRLLIGVVIGGVASAFGLPAAGIGIVFIANIFSMVGLGVGLLLKGYSVQLFGVDLGTTNIPQGVMIGAGMVALAQSVYMIMGKSKEKTENVSMEDVSYTVSDADAKKQIIMSFALHVVGALITAGITGILFDMGAKLILWVLWAGFSSMVAMVLVGMAAMHSGWFPAFAITTIFMTLGILMGFEPVPLAILTGYISSVGPCFADMGYDLKTGWLLRGSGKNKAYEVYGRKQQVIVEAIGAAIGIVVVILFANMFMKQDMMPPISSVFATAVQGGADPSLIKDLLLWAIPGAVIQLVFGTKSVGVLFATGLLLNNPTYGIGVLCAVVIRLIFGTKFMEVVDAGLIAGDGLYGFFANLIKALLGA